MALSCGTTVVKYLLFLFILLAWACGIALLGTGIWLFTTHPSASHYAHVADFHLKDKYMKVNLGNWTILVITAIVVGVVEGLFFILACLDCRGDCWEQTREMRYLYALWNVMIFVPLISVTVVTENLAGQVKSDLQGAMNQTLVKHYGQSGEMNQLITESWNFMQIEMKCCGITKNGPEDYKYTEWRTNNKTKEYDLAAVPDSCCVSLVDPNNYSYPVAKDPKNCYNAAVYSTMQERERYVYYAGCEKKLNDWFTSSLTIFISGVVVLILTQIAALVMSCCVRSNNRNSYENI